MGNKSSKKSKNTTKSDKNSDNTGKRRSILNKSDKISNNKSNEIKYTYKEQFELMRKELIKYVHKDIMELILDYIPRSKIIDERTAVSPYDTHHLVLQILSTNDLIPVKLGHSFAIYQPLCKCGTILNEIKKNNNELIMCNGYGHESDAIRKVIKHVIPDNSYYKCPRCQYILCINCGMIRHNIGIPFPKHGAQYKFANINNMVLNVGNDIWKEIGLNDMYCDTHFTRRMQLGVL